MASVPPLTITLMIVVGILAIAIPVAFAVWLRKKKGADILPFFIGCAIFIFFALVLEPLLHSVALKSPFITGNMLAYVLYGGLAAGLFEEVGRYVGIRFLMRNKQRPVNALMYGAGHGGVESALLLGANMLTYAAILLALQSGADWPVAMMGGEENLTALLQAIGAITPALLPVSLLERVLAMILHVSLSVVVYAGVVRHKLWYLPLAIGLHMLVDSGVLAVNLYTGSILLCELLCAVLDAVIVVFVVRLYRSLKAEAEVQPSAETQPQMPVQE